MEGEYKHSIQKVHNKEYLIKNACYSVTKYYLCKQNNKRSLLGRKQRSQVVRSFPNRYLFSFTNKVTSLFSIRYILIIILPAKTDCFAALHHYSFIKLAIIFCSSRIVLTLFYVEYSYGAVFACYCAIGGKRSEQLIFVLFP